MKAHVLGCKGVRFCSSIAICHFFEKGAEVTRNQFPIDSQQRVNELLTLGLCLS